MLFLKRLRSFETPGVLRLSDIATVAALLPALTIMKLPMLVFAACILVLVIAGVRPKSIGLLAIALLGLAAIFFSLYGSFNAAGLSRLRVFVELLICLLGLAVALQRLTGVVNFYLLVSPALMLALSLFFLHSIGMLAYVIAAIYLFLLLLLWHRMRAPLAEAFRAASMLFALSLPVVVLLFIFFPRISFKHASFGFKGELAKRVGHDGQMWLDSRALLIPSRRIVMEVGFEKEVPADEDLYFRGTVLYQDVGDRWIMLPPALVPPSVPKIDRIHEFVGYKVTLYPHHQRWIYFLEMPLEAPEKTTFDADLAARIDIRVVEPLTYEGSSAPGSVIRALPRPMLVAQALTFDPQKNPRSLEAARRFERRFPVVQARALALSDFFRDRNLTYTLQPGPIDLEHSVDAFLFDVRRGYCVHFAAAFATMARMAGIPARIVTGYKADRTNSVKDYLVVREEDAHAWVELMIDGAWRRVEPTATAARIETPQPWIVAESGGGEAREGMEVSANVREDNRWEALNLYVMYVKYQIETWILEYSNFRQMQLFRDLKNNLRFLVQFVGVLFLLGVLSVWLFIWLRRFKSVDEIARLRQSVEARLAALSYRRRRGETLHGFWGSLRLDPLCDRLLGSVDRLYHRIVYAPQANARLRKTFKKRIRAFLQCSKHLPAAPARSLGNRSRSGGSRASGSSAGSRRKPARPENPPAP